MREHNEKTYPYEISRNYIKSPNSLRRIYLQHPKFNGNCLIIYELLLEYWNADTGYAFPNVWQLAYSSGLSESSVKTCIKKLIELDLIEKDKSKVAHNNVYIPKKPVETLEELFEKFPEAALHHEKHVQQLRESEMKSKARWSKAVKN